MKNALIATTLVLTSGFATANTLPTTGGFNGPTAGAPVTVAQVLEAKDDTQVQMTGNIVHSLGDDEYEFTDGKNTIVIDVEDEAWAGLTISPNDKITIMGSVDKDSWEKATVDVDKITIAG
ncbi:NirD/YgiW/YdeI family stress tolerance protein [Vibrio sp. ZSDE26]|uniref:NirD/YgiW/YdeI family stress tolerance protein n=1 Tax=Vibrio amylolyticus TaxID=2847292 RepID=A0A9X1XMD2_9VIBR|nr:NirD/YgiW/YdeI family stress tolerance protein [Vibrio amylolyticus]MCK6264513.1 NirD/YgiW/YdeI family stress tolerance protein [Vibrio amylolyticus]